MSKVIKQSQPALQSAPPIDLMASSDSPVSTDSVPAHSSSLRFALLVTLAYIACIVFGVIHHEMWRDEFQGWMIAKESASPVELINNLRYEGCPLLWHLCLFALTKLTDNPLSMQLFNVAVSSASVYIVARYSPFNRFQKTAIAFGYFSLFEYGIISRCYALGNLFLFGYCAVVCSNLKKGKLALAVTLLCLLANTSFYGALIAACLALQLVYSEVLQRRKDRGALDSPGRIEASTSVEASTRFGKRGSASQTTGIYASGRLPVVMLGLLAIVLTLSLVQVIPPPDGFKGDWRYWEIFVKGDPTWTRMCKAISNVLVSYVPFPDFANGFAFWESSMFRNVHPWQRLWIAASLLLFGTYSLFLIGRRGMLISYSVGTVAQLAFSFYVLLGSMRHVGQLFMLLIACLWIGLQYQSPPHADNGLFEKLRQWSNKVAMPLFSVILITQVLAAAYGYGQELVRPFSSTGDVADYLKQNHLEKSLIAVWPDYLGVGLAAKLDRKVYTFGAAKETSFTSWGTKNLVTTAEVLCAVEKLIQERHVPIILVTEGPLSASLPSLKIRRLERFKDCIIKFEKQYIYQVEAAR